ncbi:hypothetical protein SCALM49S_09625 [Streptomyces californicus]
MCPSATRAYSGVTGSARTVPSATSPETASTWAADTGEDVGNDAGQRARVEPHVVEADVPAVPPSEFAVQQGPQGVDVLAEEGERAAGPLADAAHPVGHAVTDRDVDPTGEELGQRRDLQSRDAARCVPLRQADSDPDPLVMPGRRPPALRRRGNRDPRPPTRRRIPELRPGAYGRIRPGRADRAAAGRPRREREPRRCRRRGTHRCSPSAGGAGDGHDGTRRSAPVRRRSRGRGGRPDAGHRRTSGPRPGIGCAAFGRALSYPCATLLA